MKDEHINESIIKDILISEYNIKKNFLILVMSNILDDDIYVRYAVCTNDKISNLSSVFIECDLYFNYKLIERGKKINKLLKNV